MSQYNLPDCINIPQDEKVLLQFKREYNAFIIPYVLGILITAISLLIIFTIINVIIYGFLSQNIFLIIWWSIITFYGYSTWIILAILIGIFIVPIISYFYVKSHVYIVTNKRFIIYWKFLFINIRETKMEKLTDIIVNQSLWGRIFNFGDINPITPGLQMAIPVQGQSSGGGFGSFSAFGTGSASNAYRPITFTGLMGVKNPFEILYKFKSIDRFGKVLNANR
ncbi:MAG: PH domain-containing protein [Candidatus Helarchaeota archaeon]